jgi:hypothetical protein
VILSNKKSQSKDAKKKVQVKDKAIKVNQAKKKTQPKLTSKKAQSNTHKKKKKKKSRYYFTKETQQKIVEYQISVRKMEKDRLYQYHILPAFQELVNSLVAVYGFKSSNEDINHLKSDCVTFLFETIHKWKPENGTKAFSYFNVVAKNWLTIHSRRLLKNARRSVSFEAPEEFTFLEKSKLAEIEIDDSYEEKTRKNEQPKTVKKIIEFIKDQVKDERDKKCIDAIFQVFDNVDNLDYLNKRAVFVYLREISGLNSTELSSSLSNIRKHFKKYLGNHKDLNLF